MSYNEISTDDLIDELAQAKQSKVELEAQIYGEGDKIVGADSSGDVYLSDQVNACRESVNDITFELLKRIAKLKNKRGTTNETF